MARIRGQNTHSKGEPRCHSVIGVSALVFLLASGSVFCNARSSAAPPGRTTAAASLRAATRACSARARVLGRIDRFVRQLDKKKRPSRDIAISTGTDTDSFLITYGTSALPARAHLRVGVSNGACDTDYYFRDKQLIYVRTTRSDYQVKDNGESLFDESKLIKAGEESLHFQKGKLLCHGSSGRLAQKDARKQDAKDVLRMAAYLLRHWRDAGPLDLEDWVHTGQLHG